MSGIINIIRSHHRRAFLIAAGAGVSFLAAQALWRYISRNKRTLPRLAVTSWKLSENCEIDARSIYTAIDCLEKLLAELEPQKFHSELGRGKYDLIASIISRLRSVCSDLQKYISDDFRRKMPIEEIARTIWNKKTAPRAGTLSVLSDDSFISACDEFVAGQPAESLAASFCIDIAGMKLYSDGLKAMQSGEVVYRKSRADFCMCDSEEDYGAKLYGIRLALRLIMEDEHTVQWLIQSGRSIIAGLLRHNKREPAEFYTVYDRMMAYLTDERNSNSIKDELKLRKVESSNLWDSLFDLIILDAFEDLQKPPSSITALVNNSFLSQSMKESTINNLIWSLIKVKRTRLQIKDGFISHFYDISQILTCPLTMGLLGGSSKEYQDICVNFKENIFSFVVDIFNLNKVRYTTVEELAEDIKKLLTERVETMLVMLNTELIPNE